MLKVHLLCLIFTILLFTQCKKDEDQVIPGVNAEGKGQFSGHSGDCIATPSTGSGNTGVDVVISITKPAQESVTIVNLPTASSGTFTISDGLLKTPGTTYILYSRRGAIETSNAGGTIVKTGPKSFTFNCTVYSGGPYSPPLNGSGTYK